MARRARSTISATGSTRSCFWFTTPTPRRTVGGNAFRIPRSPARGVHDSSRSVPTARRSNTGSSGRVVAGQGRGLVARPVAPADVESQAGRRQAGRDAVDEIRGEGELVRRVPLFAERAAHEAPRVLGPSEDDLGEHGLIELHQRRAAGQEAVDLLAQDAHDVLGEVLARPVGAVRDALHPHDAGQQVGPGQGDLDRSVGEGAYRRPARARASGRLRPSGPNTAGCRTWLAGTSSERISASNSSGSSTRGKRSVRGMS